MYVLLTAVHGLLLQGGKNGDHETKANIKDKIPPQQVWRGPAHATFGNNAQPFFA